MSGPKAHDHINLTSFLKMGVDLVAQVGYPTSNLLTLATMCGRGIQLQVMSHKALLSAQGLKQKEQLSFYLLWTPL